MRHWFLNKDVAKADEQFLASTHFQVVVLVVECRPGTNKYSDIGCDLNTRNDDSNKF